MTDRPEVSVIIPTRNRWHMLSSSALPAALGQEGIRREVIVVDDGSTDGTSELLARLAPDGVQVLRHETSRGVAAARNTGIKEARGVWLAFLDDDDIWSPEKLRAQIDIAERHRADFVYSAAVVLDEQRQVVGFQPSPSDEELRRDLMSRNVVPGGCSSVVARTAVVRELGGFDEELSLFADWDLWIRLMLTTASTPCADVHVGYLQHLGNMVLRPQHEFLDELRRLADKHRQTSPEGQTIDRLSALRWAAWANNWAGRRRRAAALFFRAGLQHRSWSDIRRGLFVTARALVPSRLVERATGAAREPRTEAAPPAWVAAYEPVPALEAR